APPAHPNTPPTRPRGRSLPQSPNDPVAQRARPACSPLLHSGGLMLPAMAQTHLQLPRNGKHVVVWGVGSGTLPTSSRRGARGERGASGRLDTLLDVQDATSMPKLSKREARPGEDGQAQYSPHGFYGALGAVHLAVLRRAPSGGQEGGVCRSKAVHGHHRLHLP